MSMSVPGNSCRPCRSVTTSGCVVRLPGECVYYSGSPIVGPGINTGDNINVVINKLVSSSGGGTVTSVAATIPSGAISIAGSPITSSGTLAFTYTGTISQYIRGNGSLATFPTIPTVPTFNNGLTNNAGVVQLGGTLIQFTNINNSGNDFLLNGTGSNILRSTSGTFTTNASSSPSGSSLTSANSGTNLFSEVNSADGFSSMTAGNSTTFYNTLSVTPTFIRLETNTNTTPYYLQLNTTGQLIASRYGQGLFTGTAAYTLQVTSSGQIIEGTGSGGGNFAIIPIFSADFDPDGVTVTDVSLNGRTYEIFLNDLNRFIYNEIGNQEWDYVTGGGFEILIPGFDANTNDYHLYIYPKT